MTTLRDQLTAIDLFAGLPAAVLDELITRGSTVTFPPGSVIVQQGSAESGLHLLLAGSADVAVNDSPVGSMQVGEYFGEISLIDGAPRSATVTAGAGGQAKTFRISPLSFHEVVDANPEALRALLVCVTGRLRSAQGS